MVSAVRAQEGYVPFRGYKTWYRIVGEDRRGNLPLLCLHGGPGLPHDYLEPLEDLATTGRRVIFYDQLGCGNSDQPHDPTMWRVDLFLEELRAVRAALGLDQVHLLGQSWGGMLAMEDALASPKGIASLIVSNSPASIEQWIDEANRLRRELPAGVQENLQQHEAAGTTDTPAYVEAMLVFYRRHVCRLDPWPDAVNRAFEKLLANPEVYQTMNGPSEFFVTGVLKDWDIRDRLPEIRVPTLVLSGRYDEATPAVAETVHRGIPGSRWVLLEESSHMPFWEERGRYVELVAEFLADAETRQKRPR